MRNILNNFQDIGYQATKNRHGKQSESYDCPSSEGESRHSLATPQGRVLETRELQ